MKEKFPVLCCYSEVKKKMLLFIAFGKNSMMWVVWKSQPAPPSLDGHKARFLRNRNNSKFWGKRWVKATLMG